MRVILRCPKCNSSWFTPVIQIHRVKNTDYKNESRDVVACLSCREVVKLRLDPDTINGSGVISTPLPIKDGR